MSYYPSQGSHHGHSHHGHGRHGSVVYSQQPSYATTSSGYYPSAAPTAYVQPSPNVMYTQPTMVAPQMMQPQMMAPQMVTTVPSSYGHRHRRRHHSSHHHSRPLTLGEKIARFFGFGNSHRGVKYRGRHESWGFLGLGKRRRYVDAYTGGEVDRKGRPVYTI